MHAYVQGAPGQDGANGVDGAPGEKGGPGEKGEKGETVSSSRLRFCLNDVWDNPP